MPHTVHSRTWQLSKSHFILTKIGDGAPPATRSPVRGPGLSYHISGTARRAREAGRGTEARLTQDSPSAHRAISSVRRGPPALPSGVGGTQAHHSSFLQEPMGGMGAKVRGHSSHHLPVQPEKPLSLWCLPTLWPQGEDWPSWWQRRLPWVGEWAGIGRVVGKGLGTHRTPAAPPGRRSARSGSRCGPAAGGSGPGGCRGQGAPAPVPARPGCAEGPAPAAASVGWQGWRGPGALGQPLTPTVPQGFKETAVADEGSPNPRPGHGLPGLERLKSPQANGPVQRPTGALCPLRDKGGVG